LQAPATVVHHHSFPTRRSSDLFQDRVASTRVRGSRPLARSARKAFNRCVNRVVAALSSIGGVLRNAELRRVQLAWGVSIVAEWANFVALGVFAYHVGGTLAVGIAGLVRLLPAALVAPFAAFVGDRFRRERFLVAISAGGCLALAGSAAVYSL